MLGELFIFSRKIVVNDLLEVNSSNFELGHTKYRKNSIKDYNLP